MYYFSKINYDYWCTIWHILLLLLQYGWTALMSALDKKDFEAAEVLIKAGAGLNQQQKVMPAGMHHDCVCVYPHNYYYTCMLFVLYRKVGLHFYLQRRRATSLQ